MDAAKLIDVLRVEVVRTMGCTDPVSVAFGVARAVEALGRTPERVDVLVSPNIYKNAICVGVPGTGQRGLPIAAALGAVIADSQAGLAILDDLTDTLLASANALLEQGAVKINYADTPHVLYMRVTVSAAEDSAYVVIAGDYTHVVEVGLNDSILFSEPLQESAQDEHSLTNVSLRDIFTFADTLPLADAAFLVEAAQVNRRAAEAALADPNLKLGPGLRKCCEKELPAPYGAMQHAQMLVAAASEARMSGSRVPIMAIAGSGNQGVNNFLGVLGVAEVLGSSDEDVVRALLLSSAITVYVKGFAARMTAFCGGAIAASCGVAAATVRLLGGTYEQAGLAMQSVIGSLACIVCDGAKESCAYKMAAAVASAVQLAYLALEDVSVAPSAGIIGETIEDTIVNLGVLNNQGMAEMDGFMLNMIQNVQACAPQRSKEQ